MTTRSLRLRLLAVSIMSAAVALTATYVALVVIYARHIDRRILGELQQRSLELVGALTVDAAGAVRLDHTLSDPRYLLPYGGAYWQISAGSRTVLRSRSLWDKSLAEVSQSSGPRLVHQAGPDGDELDVLARLVSVPGFAAGPLAVSVAFGRKDAQAQRQSFAFDTGLALSVLGFLLVGGAWLQTSFGLRPLEGVRTRLAAVHRGRAQTIDGPFPDEVGPLVRDLNNLFAAQRTQVVQAREQAGDLAHALKTPLTIIEGEALRLRQLGDGTSADTLREQVTGMRRQIDRVLARARVRGLMSTAVAATSIATTVEGLFAVMRRLPQGDLLAWTNTADPALRVDMDLDDLGEVLGNLLDNARKWARSRVEVSAVPGSEWVRIIVSDDGPGMSADDQASLMSRGRTGSDSVAGTGLGLSIVVDLLSAYASDLTLDCDAEGHFCAAFSVKATIAA